MIVIIVGSAAVAAEHVEFAGKVGIRAPVVLDRIENGNAVDGDRDGAAKQCRLRRTQVYQRRPDDAES